jgi:hypothetical protein
MKFMDRRRFLLASAATAVSLRTFAQEAQPATAALTLHPETPGPSIPANFVGLSYETQQLSNPVFFSLKNTGLVAQFRALAPHGVLRIGGNTSDVGWWKPMPTSERPPLPANVTLITPPGEKSPMNLAYSVTPEAVRNLRAFLDATGWTCLYGINVGSSTPERAADEAAFVARTLDVKLEYFQLGNEPDGFPRRFREKAKWNADVYLDEWLAAANAIRARVPGARFGLPDVASNAAWFLPIATRLATLHDAPSIAAISHHYYFTGPPSNPKATLTELLKSDPKVPHNAELARTAATKLKTRWRMTEGNTCYRGGKPGLSDVFGSALWAADYLLTLASLGYAGVNLHGGSGKAVADSLGGTLPGELLMPDPKAPHPRPFYTPIAEIDGHYVLEPVAYGMMFAQKFSGATIIPIDFNPGSVNATAYAAQGANHTRLIAIINKDPLQDLKVELNHNEADSPSFHAAWTLTASSLDAHTASLAPASTTGSTFTIPHSSATIFIRPNR